MLCTALCRRAMSVCLSVCPSVRPFVRLSRSCILSNWVNIFSNFFHRSVAISLKFFHCKRYGNIPTGTRLSGTSNAGGVLKNRFFRPVSRFITCCQRFDRQVLYTQLHRTVASWWHSSLVSGVVCCSRDLLFAGDERRSVYVKKPQGYAEENRIEFNCTQL